MLVLVPLEATEGRPPFFWKRPKAIPQSHHFPSSMVTSGTPFHTDATHHHIYIEHIHTYPERAAEEELGKSKVLDVETEARNIALCLRVMSMYVTLYVVIIQGPRQPI